MKTCYLAMGANRDPSISIFCQAINLLKNLPLFNLQLSRLYLSNPEQIASHQLFFNSCISFETQVSPFALLEKMQEIEKILGKNKKKDGSRTLDLDLIFYGNIELKTKFLTLPHPHWSKRIFVVKPLSDLADQIFLTIPFNIPALVSSLEKEKNSFCEAITPGAFNDLKTFIQRETDCHFRTLCAGGGKRGSLCSSISF